MIKIAYVGDKPMITEHGVSFEPKHDKFEFIEPAIHILDMVYNIEGKKVTDKITLDIEMTPEMVFSVLSHAHIEFEEIYLDAINKYKKHLDEEITEAYKKPLLSEIERETLAHNFEEMREYRIQRATNKIVYEEIINQTVALIKKKKIVKIVVHYNNQFLHVIESISSTLAREKNGPETAINIIAGDGGPHVELDITFN